MHGRILVNQAKVQQLHEKVLLKKQKKPHKSWSDRGKEFKTKHF